MKRLSVCFIVFNGYPYTGATEVCNYAKTLASMGHKIKVITSTLSKEKQFEIIDAVKVYRIPINKVKNQLNKIVFLIYASKMLARWNEIDIIQIHQAGGFIVKTLLLLIGKNKKVKLIYNVGSGAIQKNKVTRKIGNLCISSEFPFYDSIIFVDEMVRELFPKWNKKYNLNIISLSVTINDYLIKNKNKINLLKYGIKPNDLTFIYIGNISQIRRIENLIIAFWKATKKADKLKLLILGDDKNLINLKMITKKLGLIDKILFLGHIDYLKIPLFLSQSDVGLSYIPVTPVYDPQPPQKTIEYLAASLPVIATETKGNIRFIKDGINGLIIKDNIDDLAEAILKLKNNKELITSLARKTKISIQPYDSRIIVKKLVNVYRRILQ